MQLILVRHAQTYSNVARALDTAHPGADLTELGERQVAALAEHLADEPIDGVWSSDRLRARRTAQGVAASHDLVPAYDPRLAEISAGDWEMSVEEADALGYRDAITGWILGDLEPRLLGGETGTEVLSRMDAALTGVVASGAQHAVVVSHGAAIRFWCAHRVPEIGLDLERLALGNAGFARLVRQGDGWICEEWDASATSPDTDPEVSA